MNINIEAKQSAVYHCCFVALCFVFFNMCSVSTPLYLVKALERCICNIPALFKELDDRFCYHMRFVSVDTNRRSVRIRIWGAHCVDCGVWERWVCLGADLKGPDGYIFCQIREVYHVLEEVLLVTELDDDFPEIAAHDDPSISAPPFAQRYPSHPLTGFPKHIINSRCTKKKAIYYKFHPFVDELVQTMDANVYFVAQQSHEDRQLMYKGGKCTDDWKELEKVAKESNIELVTLSLGGKARWYTWNVSRTIQPNFCGLERDIVGG